MGLMDRVKVQAAQLQQRAQEAAHEGKQKMDQAAAKRRADAMFRELGAAVYAERTGRGGTDTAGRIERLVKALSDQEAEQGLGNGPEHPGTGSTSTGPASPGPASAGTTSTGPKSAGPKSGGPTGTGPTSTGPAGTGPTSTGPAGTGPTSTGPKTPGASGT
jgi:hypothetical protein